MHNLDEALKTKRSFAISTEDAVQGFGIFKRSCMLHVDPFKKKSQRYKKVIQKVHVLLARKFDCFFTLFNG